MGEYPNSAGVSAFSHPKDTHIEHIGLRPLINDESFGLGRFATDHSFTKAGSRNLFARIRRYAPQGDH